MPPPNITGQLHIGHAYACTLQDILARSQRMRGRDVLWLPGTDHAGLATQAKLDALMRKQGLDPRGSDFEAFAADYKAGLHSTISHQIRRMGASCDWSRERFTLDSHYCRAVTKAFEICHGKGMLSHTGEGWMLDMSGPAACLLAHLNRGDITIVPHSGVAVLREFLLRIEPWSIGRRIQWGHRMPIWRLPGGGIHIGAECSTMGAEQEPGVLDTWFSSALWPMACLGWPDQTPDMARWPVANLVETGADILFFWCARMLMMGLVLTDTLAFRTIYLHGLILDSRGRKMSKSEGNGVDPLPLIQRWGCDALRLALCEDTTPGQDIRFDEARLRSARAVGTKLWNAAKFSLAHWQRMGLPALSRPYSSHADDLAMLEQLGSATRTASAALDSLDFRAYATCVRRLLWDTMCSDYIESAKPRLLADDKDALQTLMWTLDGVLRLAHPVMPFVTEAIWAAYKVGGEDMLMLQGWPG